MIFITLVRFMNVQMLHVIYVYIFINLYLFKILSRVNHEDTLMFLELRPFLRFGK